MGFLDLFRSAPKVAASGAAGFYGLDDPALLAFMRAGAESTSGVVVNERTALLNTAVFRCVSLISNTVGMLPLHLMVDATKQKADDHPLYALLHREPNVFQSAYDFRSLMQYRALVKGNAFALIVRSRGAVRQLIPLDPDHVTPMQATDLTVTYRYAKPDSGGTIDYAARDIFHLRGLSRDGLKGISLVDQAREAIGLAIAAELAVARVFKNGSFIDGTLETAGKMSGEAYNRLRDSWAARYGGAGNAGKTPLLEEGVQYKQTGSTAKDAQSNETRARQVEEIARIFGVPRPLLMVDDTSWGSGIDVLGQGFVRYGLLPWFEAWQQAVERSLLVGAEKSTLSAKFNASALERGNMASQGTYFAQALGSGGQQAWMTPNQVRDVLDMPANPDGDTLGNPMIKQPAAPAAPAAP